MRSENTTKSTEITTNKETSHKNIRRCVACRTHRHKEELIRVVRPKGRPPQLDRSGKADGRGAYLCADLRCLESAVKKNALSRALRVGVPEELRSELEEVIKFRINCLE